MLENPAEITEPSRIAGRAIERELTQLANRLDAALFLCGSKFYAGEGEDYDYRMVVPSVWRGLLGLVGRLPGAEALLPHAFRWRPNTVGLKFERFGEPVSVQLHGTAFVERLCGLEPVEASVLRATETSHANVVHGLERCFETPQPHCRLGAGAWLVHIDQDPWTHGEFCTQIYHNMVLGSRTLRDRHGFGARRRELLGRVARQIERRAPSLGLEGGLMRLMWRNQEKWRPSARLRLVAEARAAR